MCISILYIHTHEQYIVFPRKSATDTLPTLWNRDRRKINGLFTLKSTGVISQRDDGTGFMDIFYQNWCFLNMVSKVEVDYLQIVNVLSAVSKRNRGNFASIQTRPGQTRSAGTDFESFWVGSIPMSAGTNSPSTVHWLGQSYLYSWTTCIHQLYTYLYIVWTYVYIYKYIHLTTK